MRSKALSLLAADVLSWLPLQRDSWKSSTSSIPFEPLQYLPTTLRLPFAEGIAMLHQAGHEDVRDCACSDASREQ